MIREITINMEACSRKLGNLKSRLNTLVGSTEEEFLAMGKQLQDFHRRAEKMSAISADTVGLVSGDDITRAIEDLKLMLSRIEGYLKRSNEEFSRIDRLLAYNMTVLENIINTLEAFERIVKNLRVFSINIKILSADLGAAGDEFRNLAEDVKKLAQTMEESSRLILVQSRALNENIRHAVSSIAKIKNRQEELSRIILRNAESTLSSLKEKQEYSFYAATHISSLSNEIIQNTGNILVSLQFHDISRQQIEHIMEAVNDLGRMMEQGSKNNVLPFEQSKIAISAKNISKLQSAQLDHSGKELFTSIDKVIMNLGGILKDVKQIAKETQKMIGTDSADSSFLSSMETGINDATSFLFDSLTECIEIGKELSSVMETVSGTLGNITSFVDKIEGIGTEIELLSLNARIKSAHTGKEGLGLSVIAEAIQAMSEDVCKKTADISETLKGMVNAINDLKVWISTVSSRKDSEVQGMTNDLGRIRNSLHVVNGNISRFIVTLNPLADKLAEDIKRTANSITIQKMVSTEIEKCVSTLDEIGCSMSRLTVIEDKSDSNNEIYKDIESRYTMRIERNIHMLHVTPQTSVSNDFPFRRIAGDITGSVELFR